MNYYEKLEYYKKLIQEQFDLLKEEEDLSLYEKSIVNSYYTFTGSLNKIIFNIKKENILFTEENYIDLKEILHEIDSLYARVEEHSDIKSENDVNKLLFSFFYGIIDRILEES